MCTGLLNRFIAYDCRSRIVHVATPKEYQMSFDAEKIAKTGPTDLIAEHLLLVDWVKKNPNRGGVEYLDHRVIDKDAHVALYYICGIGMGDGQSFALVRGRNIFFFDAVSKRTQNPEANTISKNVSQISVPEDAKLSQKEIERLIGSALAAYTNAYGFMWSLHGNTSVSFESTRWLVIPKKYSRLYWLEKGTVWLNRQKPRVTTLSNVLTSPFAALLLLSISLASAMSDANNPSWIVILSGAWLAERLMQYDDDYLIRYWFFGLPKLKNPLSALKPMRRLMNPRPLIGLAVSVDKPNKDCSVCTISITNRTFFPVPYLSIGPSDLAELLAPGFMNYLRLKNKGAVNTNELESVYSGLVKKWILPRQTVKWSVPLLKEFPLADLKPEVTAIVTISRYVSGEPKRGPASYLLPVVLATTFRKSVEIGL